MTTVGIIDVSALLHSRMQAMSVYARHAKKELTTEMMGNNIDSTVAKFMKTYGIGKGRCLWAFDCLRENIWRHSVIENYNDTVDYKLPLYKGNRTGRTDGSFNREMYIHFINKFKTDHVAVGVCHPKLEADDVAYLMATTIPTHTKVVILTCDADYCQIDRDNTVIANVRSKTFDPIQGFDQNTSTEMRRRIVVEKCVRGDPSDNLVKTWTVRGTADALIEALIRGERPDTINWPVYEVNATMIDFKNIPIDLCDEVMPEINRVTDAFKASPRTYAKGAV